MTRSMRLDGASQAAKEDLQKRLLAGEAPSPETLLELNAFVCREFEESAARTAEDILWRRLRIGFLDEARAEMLLEAVRGQIAVLKAREQA